MLGTIGFWHPGSYSVNRERFRYVSNLCHDNYVRGCIHAVIGELFKYHWAAALSLSSWQNTVCLHMYFYGRSDGNERCGSDGTELRNKTGLTHFQMQIFVPGNCFSATVITLRPSPHLSLHLYHSTSLLLPSFLLLLLSLFLFISSLCRTSLWFVNIANMLTFHLMRPHFIVE